MRCYTTKAIAGDRGVNSPRMGDDWPGTGVDRDFIQLITSNPIMM